MKSLKEGTALSLQGYHGKVRSVSWGREGLVGYLILLSYAPKILLQGPLFLSLAWSLPDMQVQRLRHLF